ncbi:MAG: hypothetical protein GY870_11665 [archaeon]|nr:hypothetical protein [archaeon]
MRSINSKSIFSESKKDIKNCWRLLKDNYKAFLGTELFAFLSFFLIIFIATSILVIVYIFSPNLTLQEIQSHFTQNFNISHIYRIIIIGLAMFILSTFLCCQVGLAYDIMSSGDMFAEFKGSFTYFKRYWWQYSILNFFVLGLNGSIFMGRYYMEGPINEVKFNEIDLIFMVFRFIIFFILFSVFVTTLPSITAQGRLKNSFIESFRLFSKNYSRIFITWGIYFLLFEIPIFLIDILHLTQVISLINTYIPFFEFLSRITKIFFLCLYLFIGYPMMTLISTGIYNNVEFNHVQSRKDIEL